MENLSPTPVSAVTPEPVVTAPPPPQKSSSSWLKVLLFILLMGALLAGAVYGGMKIGESRVLTKLPMLSEQTIVEVPQETVETVVTPSPVSTVSAVIADWDTYTNTEKGYSIQFPKTLIRLACPDEELTLVRREASQTEPGPIVMPTCARGGRYAVEAKLSDAVLPAPEKTENYTVVKKSITIASSPATLYVFTFKNNDIGPYPEWYAMTQVEHNGGTLEIYFGDRDNLALFEQMLTTVKFAE